MSVMPSQNEPNDASARNALPTLRRTLDQYANCTPAAVSGGSQAQMYYFVEDAKHDIAALASALAAERERCATTALGQRCERGTPWDLACVTIAAAIRAGDA